MRSPPIFGLPESIKYMALHESQRPQDGKLIAGDPPRFQGAGERALRHRGRAAGAASNPVYLFRNGLWLITPLAWLMFVAQPDGLFLPDQLDADAVVAPRSMSPATAALAGAALQVGGTVGALVLCWWLQRHRFLAIAIMFVLAVPVVASIGYAGLTSTAALLAATFFAGFLVLGIQAGINVVGAMIYPTSLRANGSGWQLGIGRFGSIIGPLLGALFVGLPVEKLYMWSALPFAAGAIVGFVDLCAEHRAAPSASGTGEGAVARNAHASERLVAPQRRDHLFAEQADRAHQLGFRQIGEIEFAHEHVEQARFRRRANFCGHRVRRADENEIVLEQIIGRRTGAP